MIIHELKTEFNEYFQALEAELILWLDPAGQWKGIVERLKDEFRTVEYKGSQLEVKAEVELTWAKGEHPKYVLYLPGLSRESLTVLKEYEFSGKVFEETILQSFRRWGVEFDQQHEAELGKVLPVLASRFATKGRAFWKDRLTPENVRALLFDEENVRKMLAASEITERELKESGVYEVFCDYVEDTFGGPRVSDYEAAIWAQRFTAYLMLTEVRAHSEKPSSFPVFEITWADDRHEAQCLAFLRDWMRNATYKEDLKRLIGQVEKRYDLTTWASSLSEPTKCQASLRVEQIAEKAILSQIISLQNLSELREFLSARSEVIGGMAEHFWSVEGEIVAWRALDLARRIVEAVEHCSRELDSVGSPGDLAGKYCDSWWEIDRDYRSFRKRYDGEDKLSSLSRQVLAVYREFQNNLNGKFVSLLVQQKTIKIEGLESQRDFWERYVGASKKKRAVFLVDALRFELARELLERMEQEVRDIRVSCQPFVASTPTLTPIGMASVLPSQDILISVLDGNWDVRCRKKGESGNLALVEERKKLLKKRHPKAVFYNLDEILSPSELELGAGNPVVVFTREMDGLGHESGALNLSLDYLGQYMDGLIRAIKRLGSVGIEEAHIISDHGFIIPDDLGEADKVTVDKDVEILYRGHRCLVGKNLPEDQGPVFDLPSSEGLQFSVPRETGIFRARGSEEFFHGGLSVQELIIPGIEVIFARAQPKYGAKLKAPEVIHNLIFEIELLRAIPGEGVLFGSPRFVEIVGMIVRDEKADKILEQSGPDMVVDQAHETLKVRLRIKPDISFRYGDTLRLELRDSDTEELLDSSDIRIEVESDE